MIVTTYLIKNGKRYLVENGPKKIVWGSIKDARSFGEQSEAEGYREAVIDRLTDKNGRRSVYPEVIERKRKRRKSNSRASRLADCEEGLRNVIGKLEEAETVEAANEAISNVSGVRDEIDSLKDEISSWKENIEEKFSGTQKYSDLEECESALESIVSTLDCVEEIETLDSLQDAIDNLEGAADECGGVSFPGMFG